MGNLQLFHVIYGDAHELTERPFAKERGLQDLFEAHLRSLTGIDFLASEYSTGQRHQRRIDTLGIDAGGCPVVIEYKRSRDQNVINQGLDYLDWLEDHQAEFRELVREKLGNERSRNIDFRNASLLCVAGEFQRQDEVAARNSRRRIGLLRYRRYEEAYVTLEWIFGEESATKAKDNRDIVRSERQSEAARKSWVTRRDNQEKQQSAEEPDYSKYKYWQRLKDSPELYALFVALRDFARSLGDDVKINPTQEYIGFWRNLTLAFVRLQPGHKRLLVYIITDLENTVLREGFTSLMPEKHHFGRCNLQVFIDSVDKLESAKPLIKRSYDEAG